MRTFIDTRKTSRGDEPGVSVTNGYIELEIPVDRSTALVVYVIPRSEHSAFVATCWDRVFDAVVEDLDDDTAETIVETWPTLATLLGNGATDRYRDGALIRLEDVDDGETKWFVASVAGNISFDSAEEVFGERTQAVIRAVLETSGRLATELNENEPSALRAIGRGLLAGIGAALGLGVAAFLGVPAGDSA